ncbi:hypothetical protein HDU86_003059 [Geranomyces michiganensis]|nr:hypothetical protein HDU86_003059 [Geranomyces michiganensis]
MDLVVTSISFERAIANLELHEQMALRREASEHARMKNSLVNAMLALKFTPHKHTQRLAHLRYEVDFTDCVQQANGILSKIFDLLWSDADALKEQLFADIERNLSEEPLAARLQSEMFDSRSSAKCKLPKIFRNGFGDAVTDPEVIAHFKQMAANMRSREIIQYHKAGMQPPRAEDQITAHDLIQKFIAQNGEPLAGTSKRKPPGPPAARM